MLQPRTPRGRQTGRPSLRRTRPEPRPGPAAPAAPPLAPAAPPGGRSSSRRNSIGIACALSLTALTAPLGLGCQVAQPAPPSALDRLLPAVKGHGLDGMDEQAVARELERAVDLDLPARALVLGLDEDGEALAREVADELGAASHLMPVVALRALAHEPLGDSLVQHLRLLAVRHRTPYVLLVSAHLARSDGFNGLAWLYPLLLPLAVVPGDRQALEGTFEAALVDVRSGAVVVAVALRVEATAPFVFRWEHEDASRALLRDLRQREGPALADKLHRALVRAATTTPSRSAVGGPRWAGAGRDAREVALRDDRGGRE